MSLIQHVHALEGQDREEALVDLFRSPLERQFSNDYDRLSSRRSSFGSQIPGSQKTIHRIISYDALKLPEETLEEYGGLTPYHVSTAKRIAQIIVTVLSCWFASGIVFGFAALKPILVKEGVFRETCKQEELDANVDVCFDQDLRLNFFFSLASTTANVSALPIGAMLDRYGPGVCFLFGSLCLTVGSILMSLAFRIDEFDGYTVGNFFLALGGTSIFLPSFQIANAFPKYSGSIVALVTGAFDASAAVFLFYRLAYESSGGSFKPQTFFLAYLAVPIAIVFAQLTILPSESYKTPPQIEMKIHRAEDPMRDVHVSDDELPDDEVWRRRKQRSARRRRRLNKLDKLFGDEEARKKREEEEEHRHEASGVWGALHNKSSREQMTSPWFVLITLLTVLQMVRMNYFIATIREQYNYMLNPILAIRVNSFFDIALPLGGVLSTPFLGIMLDNISTPNVLLILVFIISVIGIVGSIPALWAAYINIILFVFLRPLYYSAMSDYAAKVFGFATFGRVYGTIICFSGLVNLSQTGIEALIKGTFHGNPIPVNAVLGGASFVIGGSLVTYVSVQVHRWRKKMEEEDYAPSYADTETGSMMDSLLEEPEDRNYGCFRPNRAAWDG